MRHRIRSMLGHRADDRGLAAVEMAVVAPFLVGMMLLVMFVGRVSEADANVQRAASEAARAASLRQHPVDAVAAAESTVHANLSASGVACTSLAVDVDTAVFEPGGQVSVTVTCTASMSDVGLIGVPGTRTFSAHKVEVIDRFRANVSDGVGEGS
jgi:Flp pilus assembly protein TadG